MTEYKGNETFGVFVFAGYAPATDAVKGVVELNEQGSIITDASQKTSIDGVYAAGAGSDPRSIMKSTVLG